jgi:hypothetical protein
MKLTTMTHLTSMEWCRETAAPQRRIVGTGLSAAAGR